MLDLVHKVGANFRAHLPLAGCWVLSLEVSDLKYQTLEALLILRLGKDVVCILRAVEQTCLSQVRLSQVREERVSEEWSKKKLLKKPGETEARKQKTLKVVRATSGSFCV